MSYRENLPLKVIKRDGSTVDFDQAKIAAAIRKAGAATSQFDDAMADELAAETVRHLNLDGCMTDRVVNIEAIQDTVERILATKGYFKTFRTYALYREQRAKARGDKRTVVDVGLSMNEYLDREDWRVRANANQGYSLGGLILNVSGKVTANYWLNHVYPPEIGEAHRNGDFHIHDLDLLAPYCCGWSLRTLLQEGFNGVPGKVEASPPKHMSSAVGQIVNFMGTLQNEWAGAQAFSSFDTYMAPFIRKDNMSYVAVKQCIQELVYNLNAPSRWGGQAIFSNLTFDFTCPKDLKDKRPIIGGEEMPFVYGDLHTEMDIINQAYVEVMTAGDAKGRIFTFPIPTYNITDDFPWDDEKVTPIFEMTAKYGTPYFQNFINSDLDPHMIRAMCCRLRIQVGELLKRGNGLFGSAEQTGSIGVVTINCARLGYLYRTWEELTPALDHLLVLAKNSLEIKRKEIQRRMDDGLFPYTKRYLGTLRNHFSTIGVNGINEMICNFYGDPDCNITKTFGHELAMSFLDHIRAKMTEFQTETGHLYNLEATPAEGTTYRFAREDKKRFPDILQAGTPEKPYYTNSSQLPVGFTNDPFEALAMQEELQKKYTGGTVLHLYLGERVSSAEACKRLIKTSLERFGVPYITVTPTFSICPSHGYLAGEQPTCPECGATCEVWTRVMGYYRPVSAFNTGKQGEYEERVCFEEPKEGK